MKFNEYVWLKCFLKYIILWLIVFICAPRMGLCTVHAKYRCGLSVVLTMLYVYFRYRGAVIGTQYGPGTGRILLKNTMCRGNERSIFSCPRLGLVSAVGNRTVFKDFNNCNHSKDVSVSCGTSPVQQGNWYLWHYHSTAA